MGSTRFRFLYYLAAWLELAVIGNHIGWFVPLNIILNGCIAYSVYRFGKRLSRSYLMGLGCGFLYILSRMSYYQISQVLSLIHIYGGLRYIETAYRNVVSSKSGLSVRRYKVFLQIL